MTNRNQSNNSFANLDINPAQGVGIATGVVTVGGAVAVGAAVLPAQVATGLAICGLACAMGQAKKETGHYLPFLHNDKSMTMSERETTNVYDPTNDGTVDDAIAV